MHLLRQSVIDFRIEESILGGAQMNYAGIDHHRQYSHITLLDEKGEVVKSGRVANFRRELEKFLQGIGNIKAVIEAGRSSYTMVDVLDDMGIETAIAHPKDIKAIAKAKIKTDERDSYKLAHLLRTDYIPEVYKRSRENRSSQRVLRQRAFYVEKQTSVKNRLRALLAQQGEEIRKEVALVENLFTAKGMRVLEGLDLPEIEGKMVGALLKTYLHAYAGVIPSTHSSGERSYHGKIIKEGNRWLRWAAVEAVWPAIRADFDIRLYNERMKRRKGANSAKVATARRLLTIIYRMLKENRPYIPYKR